MDEQRDDVIVVGVDGTPGSDAALDFALSEGLSRGCTVEVVTGWLWTSSTDGLAPTGTLAEGRAEIARMQDIQLTGALTRLGATPSLAQLVVHDYAGRVLVARAEHAAMLVVSGGTQGSASRKSVGSIAEYCVRHSAAPVVVVPDPARARRRASGPQMMHVAAS
jgi:nucleotide-binding universal stress UspA family protein